MEREKNNVELVDDWQKKKLNYLTGWDIRLDRQVQPRSKKYRG